MPSLRRAFALFALLVCMVILAIGGRRAVAAAPPASWRVLVYMAADNDLEPAAANSLAEIQGFEGSGAVRLAVQVDRAGRRSRDGHGFAGTRRFVSRRGLLGGWRVEQAADLGPTDSGSPATLRGFLDWGMQAVPGDRTLLVLWGHGRGDRGLLVDVGAGSHMTPADLREVLSGRGLDVLAMDVCSMQTLDVAGAVGGAASYLAGSPSPRHALGWPYAALLGALEGTPEMPASDVAAWLARHAGDRGGEFTGSSLDLARIAELDGRVDAALDAARALPAPERAHLEAAITALPAVARVARTVDLATALTVLSAAVPEQAQAARRSLASAVLVEAHSPEFSDTAGLAVSRSRLLAALRSGAP